MCSCISDDDYHLFFSTPTVSAASVTLEMVANTMEGNTAVVTVLLSLPSGGSAIPITVTLGDMPGPNAGTLKSLPD